MAFIEETSNTRIATTALWQQVRRPVHLGIGEAGELDVPMARNTGARDSQPCLDLIGLGRICLHFNSG